MIKKKYLYIAAVLFLFASCDNELDLLEEGASIPVVYALLDVTDSAQYVRVEKAFSDQNTPASVLALDPNNLYYQNAEVILSVVGKEDHVMMLVDANLEGFPRAVGSFAQTPNYVYKLISSQANIEVGDVCIIKVRLDDGQEVEAQTLIIEPAVVIKPRKDGVLDFDESSFIRYSWNAGKESVVHSMAITINYDESVNGGSFEPKSIVWNIIRSSGKARFEFKGSEFYQFLGSELEVDPSIKRVLKDADVLFVSGGQAIADFTRVSQANLGITSSGDIPVFTNVSGGRGLVGSRAKIEIPNLLFSNRTLEFLRTLDETADLNFQ